MRTLTLTLVFSFLVLFILFSNSVIAPATCPVYLDIQGDVKDPAGNAVPGVTTSISVITGNAYWPNGAVTFTTTDSNGHYKLTPTLLKYSSSITLRINVSKTNYNSVSQDIIVTSSCGSKFNTIVNFTPPTNPIILTDLLSTLVASLTLSKSSVNVGEILTASGTITAQNDSADNVQAAISFNPSGCGSVTSSTQNLGNINKDNSANFNFDVTANTVGTCSVTVTPSGKDASTADTAISVPDTKSFNINTPSDVTPPTVTGPTFSKNPADAGDSIQINCTAVDGGGISSVIAAIKDSLNVWTNLTMSYLTGITYTTTFSTNIPGDYAVYCAARDNSNNYGQSGPATLTINPIVDTEPPTYSPNCVGDAQNTYTKGRDYLFICGWTDNVGIDTVLFEFNGIDYTPTSSGPGVWEINMTDLPANETGYPFRWFANDASGNMAVTPISNFFLLKTTPILHLTLNDVGSDLTVQEGTETNATGWVETGDTVGFDLASLYRQGSGPGGQIFGSPASQIVTLPVGEYQYLYSYAETENFTNSDITRNLTVTQTPDVEPPKYYNLTATPDPAVYVLDQLYTFSADWINNRGMKDVIFEWNDSVNYTYLSGQILRNGDTFSVILEDLPANETGYYYRWFGVDTSDLWNNTPVNSYPIAKASNIVHLYLNGNEQDLTIHLPEQVNATGTSIAGFNLYRDGQDVTSENGQFVSLPANPTGYLYKVNSTGNENYSTNSTGMEFTVFVLKTLPGLSLTFVPDSPQIYGTEITATCNVDNAEQTPRLFRNGFDVSLENGKKVLLGGGDWNYTCEVDESASFSAASIGPFVYHIDRATSATFLFINEKDSDIEVDQYSINNFNVSSIGGKIVSLNSTMPGWSIVSGASPFSYNANMTETGLFTFSGIFDGDENYTGNSASHNVNVVCASHLMNSFVDSTYYLDDWKNIRDVSNVLCSNSTDTNTTESNSYYSELITSLIGLSRITNSKVVSGDIYNCTITDSTVGGYCRNSVIDPSDIDNTSQVNDSTITDSKIWNYTNVSFSTIINSTIVWSTIDHSTVIDSYVNNSSVVNSIVTNSNITDSNITNSKISNSDVRNSTIINSDVRDMIVEDALIVDNILKSGCITYKPTGFHICDSDFDITTLYPQPPVGGGGGGSGYDFRMRLTAPTDISLYAGQSATFTANISNIGYRTITGLTLNITGVPSSWLTVTPGPLNVTPGEMSTFTIKVVVPLTENASIKLLNLEASSYELGAVTAVVSMMIFTNVTQNATQPIVSNATQNVTSPSGLILGVSNVTLIGIVVVLIIVGGFTYVYFKKKEWLLSLYNSIMPKKTENPGTIEPPKTETEEKSETNEKTEADNTETKTDDNTGNFTIEYQ